MKGWYVYNWMISEIYKLIQQEIQTKNKLYKN